LVGGAVRDLYLGFTPRDYDFLVEDPKKEAEAAAQALGLDVFALREGVMRAQGRGLVLDFAPLPEGGLFADLCRRDYTVNALAMNRRGAVFGLKRGLMDLKARRLRALARENLEADPVRAFRAVRLWVTRGLRPEPRTWSWIREEARRIRFRPPPMERIAEEFRQILGHPRAAFGVQKLKESGLLAVFLPELATGAGVAQGGYHHLDVLGHEIEALFELLCRFPEAGLDLRFATLVHDVAKPLVRQWDETRGYYRFFHHDEDGAALARTLARRLGFGREDRRRIEAWVRAHMRLPPESAKGFLRWLFKYRTLLPELLMLQISDRAASRGPLSDPEEAHWLTQRLDAARRRLAQLPTRPRLDGRELMALTGRSGGPWIEQLKALLLKAEWEGKVSSYEEAKDFVKSWHEAEAAAARDPRNAGGLPPQRPHGD